MEEDYIKKLYTNVNIAGSYGGLRRFYNNLSQDDKQKFKYADVKRWLSKQEIQPYVKSRNKAVIGIKFYVSKIDEIWQADVAYASQMMISKKDEKFMSFLLIIDVFSRFCFTRPLKQINADSVVNALEDIFESTRRRCQKIQFDKGSEFMNHKIKSLLDQKDIKYYFVSGSSKAAFAERCILSIKKRLSVYFVYHKGKKHWYDDLKGITASYNGTVHSSHGFRPSKIRSIDQNLIWMRTYKYNIVHSSMNKFKSKDKLPLMSKRTRASSFRYKVNDRVRISVFKDKMLRAYSSQYTNEVFTIIDRKSNSGYFMYLLKDYNNKTIEGFVYENELIKVHIQEDQIYKIEKILKKTRHKSLVKWLDWPNQFNSWVLNSDIMDMTVEI